MELIRDMILQDLTKHHARTKGSAVLSKQEEQELQDLADEITAKVAKTLKIKEYPECQ